MKKQITKFSVLTILLLSIILCMSVFLVSCDKPKPNRTNPPYDDFEEEPSEDVSSEEDLQYSMGLNGGFADNSLGTYSYIDRAPVYVPDTTVYTDMLTKRNVKLPVTYLPQKPELPSGCEITSLTTVLNFYGYNVTKTEMADNYLPKSNTSKDYWRVFIGNPRYNTGFGCYAQPITDAANKYFAEQGNRHIAYNYSGVDFEQLLLEVENGRPVVIWGTLNMAKPYYSYKWILEDGTERRWIIPEHCLVLIGYDLDRSVAIISDPMRGIVEYDLKTVKLRFLALDSQCVVIY